MIDDLPPWLNPFQLVAWVQYRDARKATSASTHSGLAALYFYDEAERIGSIGDLACALQEGRLEAQGKVPGVAFAPIQPVEWSTMPVAPLQLSKQHPYCAIKVRREDMLMVFPPIGVVSRTGPATSTIGAENECRDWLAREFASDPEHRRDKASFRGAALLMFQGRISSRGFNYRVWPEVARAQGRSRPGAKRKS